MAKIPANYHLIRYLKNHIEDSSKESVLPFPLEPVENQALFAGAAIMAMFNDLVAPMSPLQSGNYSVMHYNDVEAHSRIEPDELFESGERIEYQIIDHASDSEKRVLIMAHYNYLGNFEWITLVPRDDEELAYLGFYRQMLDIYEKAFNIKVTELKNG